MRAREWTGRRRTPYLILAILTIGSANLAPAQRPDSTEFFESKIRPLFAAKCQECHGPKQQLGQLDLSRPEGLQRNTSAITPATEPVLVPGDPNASLLIRAVRYQSDIKMPPTGRLSESEIADLTRWVELGAPWPEETKAGKIKTRAPGQPITDEERAFWAFQPVTHPAPPKVRNESWLRTPVDRFILARLESQGDTPAPPVDKLTLLRRVTYDLTGLPPTEREIGEFLEDSSSGAYRKVVERLLASSRYGERWGRHWLDVARYADSTGVDEDHKYPYAWKYRDYVIDAFNEDLPYDRFLQEQVAGDLMPTQGAGEVNARGIIATGFLALGPKLIAEQDKKKMFYDIVDEQIEVVGKSILGLTLQCARCHDHKFDPIRTRDYYSLASIFASTKNLDDWQAHVSKLYFAPLVPSEIAERYYSHLKKIDLKKQEIANVVDEQTALHVMHLLPRLRAYLVAARELLGTPAEEETEMARSVATAETTAAPAAKQVLASVSMKYSLDAALLTEWVDYLKPTKEVRPHLDRWRQADSAALQAVVRAYQTDFEKTATKRYDDLSGWRAKFTEAVAKGEETPERPRFFDGENRFFTETTAAKGPLGVSKEERERLFSPAAVEQLARLNDELKELNTTLPPKPPMANAVAEDKPIQQHVFISGNVRRLGDYTPKGFPVVLAGDDQPAITQGSGRLELARWLSSPNNPLTARVMVNRIWQWHFGEGLVRTPNNFGKLGERPTHAALLDYLATEFVRSGWSIKAMHRLILFSNAYSMRAEGDAGNYRSDPENRLWSHFNRRRMDAEEIRDSLLAIEGTIDFGMGGTLQIGTGMGMTTTSQIPPFDVSTSFRRTVYLPLRRSNIAKMLTLFDFGDAVTSTGRRARTNVAPQALFMMNSKFVSRVAKGLTRRVLAERGTPDEQRVRSAWLTILAKEPSQIEIGEALVYIREFQEGAAEKDFTEIEGSRQEEGHHLSADQPAYYYGPSTLAAWQSYCKILVASNDFIYIQ
jgi:hypothetical protein